MEPLIDVIETRKKDIYFDMLLEGQYGCVDSGGEVKQVSQKLQAGVMIRAGKMVWDLNGIAARRFVE